MTDAEAEGCDEAEPNRLAETQAVGLREKRRDKEGVEVWVPEADAREVTEAHTEEDVERLAEYVDEDCAEEDAA